MSFLAPDTPAPLPPPPDRNDQDVQAASKQSQELLRRSLAGGRQSTILGGSLGSSVGGRSILTKTSLGE